MKFSGEIFLTVLMGSFLCFQLALAQCDISKCEEKKGCCNKEAGGCYLFTGEKVKSSAAAGKACDTLDAGLPEPILDSIPLLLKSCERDLSLPFHFYAKGNGPDHCPHFHVDLVSHYFVHDHCSHNEDSIVVCFVKCEC
ncbi:UNVERIFIED_CONTAM: hypothetical protein RMT77_017607 [Armadillidium vulgare]